MLGPGVVWLALAQGSSELIWWPYLIAKYGLALLWCLVPACLLQYPVTYALGYYTALTGEGIFHGFARWSHGFAAALWGLMVVAFLWFGAFALAGGTALAALTGFPPGWEAGAQARFWGYLSMGVYLIALRRSRRVYRLIERVMWGVAGVTVVGLVAACSMDTVRGRIPEVARGLVGAPWPADRPWDPADATTLLTAITFAGLGGFWTLFYSYWLREKGVGMAAPEMRGALPEAGPAVGARWQTWRRFLVVDAGIGIVGNLLTTLMTCLLAYALLFPERLLPEHFELAVVQSRFFEVSWGGVGRALFLVVAAAFLSDTWMATVDAVARVHAACTRLFVPAARRIPEEVWYRRWIWGLTAATALTMAWREPGPLIQLSAVLGFVGTVLFSGALWCVTGRVVGASVERALQPGPWARAGLAAAAVCYLGLAAGYVWVRWG